MAKQRIDERLVEEGLAESRSLAQRLVMAGSVRVNGQRVDKSSTRVADTDTVELTRQAPFVSRGGEKLDNALADVAATLEELELSVAGARAIDIGASTGGFTDCLLQRGAASVIAVDVGYGQLHPKLRDDPRVVVMERTNARDLTPEMLPHAPNVVVCDASFIPLRTVLPATIACMEPGFWGLVLCKPQFEAGRERLNRYGSKGVLRDEAVRDQVVEETLDDLRELGLRVEATVEARPTGPKGNREFGVVVRDSRE
jgi:23S rRNA (cytidine1920-2'-O)/16S rRNA (cytidine1409-2'-O)-methyltransferase